MRFGGFIAAIVFAAIAAVIVLRMSASEPAPAANPNATPVVKTVNIYVAAQAIPVGSTITQEMVSVQPWPEHLLIDGVVRVDSGDNVVGMLARSAFQPQEPILRSKVANASDPNFLAGSLPKGMRVVTIQTNEIDGVGGFVFPGDRVDILLTREVQKWVTPPSNGGEPGAPRQVNDAVTETLLTNVTVLAVDQRSSAAGSVDKNGKLMVPRSVSLMASPSDAQRLKLAARKGTLTLTLRSLEDRESSDPLIITGISDISQYPDQTTVEGGGEAGQVLIIRGTKTETSKSVEPPPAEAPAPVISPVNTPNASPQP